MNSPDRFNQGGFSLWWTAYWLRAIFCAWVIAALLGFFLHSNGFSALSNMLSDIFIYVVLLTVVVQGALWLCRPTKSQ